MFGWLNFRKPQLEPRPFPMADERAAQSMKVARAAVDKCVFAGVIAQWAIVMLATLSWSVGVDFAHTEAVWTVLVLNGVLTGASLWLLLRSPGTSTSRLAVAVGQGLYSTLLFQASAGRLESHLHLFVWLIVLATYLDVRVLCTAAFVAAGSQLAAASINGSPLWGGTEINHLVEHAVLLVVEMISLSMFVNFRLRGIADLARREAALESLNNNLERKVERRTREVSEKLEELNREYSVIRDVNEQSKANELSATRQLSQLRSDVLGMATTLMDTTWRWSEGRLPEGLRPHWRAIREASQRLLNLVQDEHQVEDSLSDSLIGSSVIPPMRSLIGEPSKPKDHGPQTLINQFRVEAATSPHSRAALLLMDDPVQQALTTYALSLEGFRAEVAHSGPRAYYSAMLRDYELILVDVDMANEEGFDTIEALRLLPDRVGREIGVFAIASARTPDLVLRGTQLGVDGLILKPVDAESLRAALEGNSLAPVKVRGRRASDRIAAKV